MAVATATKTVNKKSRDERLDFRLTGDHKRLIEQAAAAEGRQVSDFGVTAMVAAAQQAIERQTTTTLSSRDRDLFLKLLDNDAAPNAALSAAADRYKSRRAGKSEKKGRRGG